MAKKKKQRNLTNPFKNYDFEMASAAFTKLKTDIAKTEANRKYVEGDDWQDGSGWVGPHFDGEGKVNKILKKEVQRDFASKGDIKSAVRRHRRGVIGRVPSWLISSRNAPSDPDAEASPEETELIGEAQKILNEFWKNSRVHTTLKDFVDDYLTTGHAVLRLYFVQNENGEFDTPQSIEDAVKMIHLFREKPEDGCIVVDRRTLKRASFVRYETDGVIFIEMCYVDENGDTIFKKFQNTSSKDFADKVLPTIGSYHEGDVEEEFDGEVLPLNGKLLVFEMNAVPFISAAMRSQQKLVNKAYTMMSHNLDEDGFRKKKILNGLPPGEFRKNAEGEQIYVPNPDGEVVGAGSISYTMGLPTVERDAEGRIKTSYTTPSVHESEPISIETFTKSAEAGSDAILDEADQMHIKISGDSEPSGESRIQAKDDFRQSLEDTKSDLDDCLSEAFETVLAVVAYLMELYERYEDLQVSVSANLNTGPKSLEERRVAREEADAGYRSEESAMEEMNINDPDAMKKKIAAETKENKKNGFAPRRSPQPIVKPDPEPESALK